VTSKCLDLGHHEFSFLRASLSQDVSRYLNKSPMNQAAGNTLRARASAFFMPDLTSIFLYRISHWLHANGFVRVATLVNRLNFLAHKASISSQSCIGPGLRLPHPAGVVFCGTAGRDLTLYSCSVCGSTEGHADGPLEDAPHLGDRVTIGAHAALLGPLRVGDDTKIGFMIRLDRDAPDRVLVVSRMRSHGRRLHPACPVSLEDIQGLPAEVEGK
jgi:serine O-acetyltransferase